MASIYLDVPFVTQLGFGPNQSMNDPLGCWYASACMLGYYFEAGPRLGDPTLWTSTGHQAITDTTNLQRNERLKQVGYPNPKWWSLDSLSALLRGWGPQLISWRKTRNGNTYGHCCALIGTDDANSVVIIHDPENAPNFRMMLATFNSLFMWDIPDSMLRKDVAQHTPKLVRGS